MNLSSSHWNPQKQHICPRKKEIGQLFLFLPDRSVVRCWKRAATAALKLLTCLLCRSAPDKDVFNVQTDRQKLKAAVVLTARLQTFILILSSVWQQVSHLHSLSSRTTAVYCVCRTDELNVALHSWSQRVTNSSHHGTEFKGTVRPEMKVQITSPLQPDWHVC